MILHATLALAAGAAIAVQAAMNSTLGRLLGSPLFATVVAFGTGFVFALAAALVQVRAAGGPTGLRDVPVHLWFAGGLLGAAALGCFYWLIPTVGIGTTIAFALTGQLLLALVAGHFGWFDLPPAPLSGARLVGASTLVVGTFLIHRG